MHALSGLLYILLKADYLVYSMVGRGQNRASGQWPLARLLFFFFLFFCWIDFEFNYHLIPFISFYFTYVYIERKRKSCKYILRQVNQISLERFRSAQKHLLQKYLTFFNCISAFSPPSWVYFPEEFRSSFIEATDLAEPLCKATVFRTSHEFWFGSVSRESIGEMAIVA